MGNFTKSLVSILSITHEIWLHDPCSGCCRFDWKEQWIQDISLICTKVVVNTLIKHGSIQGEKTIF
ncbi:frataxin domain-containing protein [uncultured Christiangramia sp.]|uniref:frataxin domain-containing protein n=1 Tax=uncultured Christiangramia sp. TaxID=503836 RepID=UPI00345672DC